MTSRTRFFGLLLAIAAMLLRPAHTQPSPQAQAAFDNSTRTIEARLDAQHRSPDTFLAGPSASHLSGAIELEHLSPASSPPGSMLHHWRASAFLPGAHAADLERLLRDFHAYPERFAPEVLSAHVLHATPAGFEGTLRVRQKHVLTVVLDTTYSVAFGHLDPRHGFSTSRSTHVEEIAAPGTPDEHPLSPAEEHGFLWRQNTYWSWSEADGGLHVQVESVSLSRAVPTGLGWAVRPFVESIPRESLSFTLERTAAALSR